MTQEWKCDKCHISVFVNCEKRNRLQQFMLYSTKCLFINSVHGYSIIRFFIEWGCTVCILYMNQEDRYHFSLDVQTSQYIIYLADQEGKHDYGVCITLFEKSVIYKYIYKYFVLIFFPRVQEGLLSVLGYCCTLCTIFGRMTGFEPELLRPGMSLMGYPYPFFTFLFALLFLCLAREQQLFYIVLHRYNRPFRTL